MNQFKSVKLGADFKVLTPAKATFEIKFIHKEIFIDRCYWQHGIAVSEGDTVVDVGANVGLFSLSLAKAFHRIDIYAFEPTPPTFACL